MSVVTNLILCWNVSAEEDSELAQVNVYFDDDPLATPVVVLEVTPGVEGGESTASVEEPVPTGAIAATGPVVAEFPSGHIGGPGFVSVEDPRLPRGWYGGTKMMETNVALGAFNHLDIAGLWKHLRTGVRWRYPESVQLFCKHQEGDRFVVATLDMEQVPPADERY